MKNNLSTPHKIIVILGPTASGKSELAVKLAKKFNGEIISADSRQVYKELNIGSGKVSRDKKIPKFYILNPKSYFYKGIPHHLLNIVSPKRTFTVSQYQKLAKKTLADIIKRDKLPIICGGTGLYIDALIYDYQLPKVPPNQKLRKQLERKTTEELFERLKKLDSRRTENIDKNNRRRLIRALEIVLTTKKPIPIFNIFHDTTSCGSAIIKTPYDTLKIGINLPKEKLQKKITKRIKQMLKNGLLNEIKKLRREKISWNKIYSFGFEYKYPALFLQNKISKKEMIGKMITENWRYAKRQMTWFKRDGQIQWLKNRENAHKTARDFLFNE